MDKEKEVTVYTYFFTLNWLKKMGNEIVSERKHKRLLHLIQKGSEKNQSQVT